MSRIGKKPIDIPDNVEVKLEGDILLIKGPQGELKQQIHPLVSLDIKDKQINVKVENTEKKSERAMWGLFGSLINNMIIGVTEGFSKKLEVIGIGFKVNLQGDKLVLNVGYSHPVEFTIPQGIKAEVDKNNITISGPDKQLVGEVAAKIRKIRKPEPYKGKGIKYSDEIIRKKVGKAAGKEE